MDIKRYELDWVHRDEATDGDWVLYRDIEPLLKDAEELGQIMQGIDLCCCGDSMKGYHDNHSPVSMFDWHLECIRRDAWKAAVEKCARIALNMETVHFNNVGDPRVSVASTPIADKLLSLIDGGLEI